MNGLRCWIVAAMTVALFTVVGANCAMGQVASASSEWGPGYGAASAADEVAHENSNYWQTVQGKDRGAWWQLDFGRVTALSEIRVVWARYEDKFHCPPASMALQLSDAAAGPWKDMARASPADLPRDGQAYSNDRVWRFAFPSKTSARCVRLVFPDGSQPGARHPGYLCLGEVEVPVPEPASRLAAIEGGFGKAEVNIESPSLRTLTLRCPGGMSAQSVLARRGAVAYPGYGRGRGRLPWAQDAYTYVVLDDGTRYESRRDPPQNVERTNDAGRTVIKVRGVRLAATTGGEALAVEDWTLATADASLRWTIERTWRRDATLVMSGSPGLFFAFDARHIPNSVTNSLWYDPERLAVRPSELYNMAVSLPGRIAENHVSTILDRDAWAVYKLWTTWRAPADLRLQVSGGHLYRRGSFAFLSEAGAVVDPAPVRKCRAGQVERITVDIAPIDAHATGYQLAVALPDKTTEKSLKDFYNGLLNGGIVSDQKHYDFGNETDGWNYAGSAWMQGAALAAGVPAPGNLSSRPYDVASAFRGHLAHITQTLDDQGRARFGYNQTGQWVDDNLHTILGVRFYAVHSGDLAFVRGQLPLLERMLGYFVKRRDGRGLFKLDDVGAHWYYDCIATGGVNAYYNAFFYKAACDLAELEEAAGFSARAAEYRALAASLKQAFNAVFWRDNLPGGPRYIDWIDAQGKEVAYFCDLCQWPAVAVGIASPEQARKIVATADRRIAELEKQYGYRGYASLSALWPAPVGAGGAPWQTFGVYMNGGSLLCQTYWEILARARAGDRAGAARRLRLFAQRAGETAWSGNNSADIHGQRGAMESGEPYLADMVVVCAAAVHGVLGIQPTWNSLQVDPRLPDDWPAAEAEILYKGRRHKITIRGAGVHVQMLSDAK